MKRNISASEGAQGAAYKNEKPKINMKGKLEKGKRKILKLLSETIEYYVKA